MTERAGSYILVGIVVRVRVGGVGAVVSGTVVVTLFSWTMELAIIP